MQSDIHYTHQTKVGPLKSEHIIYTFYEYNIV